MSPVYLSPRSCHWRSGPRGFSGCPGSSGTPSECRLGARGPCSPLGPEVALEVVGPGGIAPRVQLAPEVVARPSGRRSGGSPLRSPAPEPRRSRVGAGPRPAQRDDYHPKARAPALSLAPATWAQRPAQDAPPGAPPVRSDRRETIASARRAERRDAGPDSRGRRRRRGPNSTPGCPSRSDPRRRDARPDSRGRPRRRRPCLTRSWRQGSRGAYAALRRRGRR